MVDSDDVQIVVDFEGEGVLVEHPLPTPLTTISIEILGGAVSRVDPAATAYPHRDAAYDFGVWGNWTDPGADEDMTQWVRDCHAAISPYASGEFYVNYLDSDEGDRIRAAFGDNYDRLADVKATRDPANLFNRNKNIQPAD